MKIRQGKKDGRQRQRQGFSYDTSYISPLCHGVKCSLPLEIHIAKPAGEHSLGLRPALLLKKIRESLLRQLCYLTSLSEKK
jgi:hypothetical protein